MDIKENNSVSRWELLGSESIMLEVEYLSLEWFYRMENAIRITLPEISAEFDEFEILFETNTTEPHPIFSFLMTTSEQIYEFCVIQFDPINQEFYSYHYNEEVELDSKVLFSDLDEMLQYIYDSLLEFMDDHDENDDDLNFVDELEQEFLIYSDDDEEDVDLPLFDQGEEAVVYTTVDDENDIDWISNDKHLHIESNHLDHTHQFMIHLRMGVDPETGDGILYRNIVTKNEDDMEETVYYPFKEEEAAYMIDLLNDYLNYLNKH